MTNKEWLMSLNKQQRRRRRNKGEIPEFAIYRVYNHNAKQWQFTDIISTSKAKAQLELKKRLGSDSFKWRFEVQPWLVYNPVTHRWAKVQYAFERGGKEPLENIVLKYKNAVSIKCNDWLVKEHKDE